MERLDEFPLDTWSSNIELVYFSYHIMVGLGTIFIAIFAIAALLLWRRALYRSRAMLWIILLALPFPFIANMAGWITAEVGRQPGLCMSVADAKWSITRGFRGQRMVHADRIHGSVHGTRHFIFVCLP